MIREPGLFEALRTAVEALESHGVRYALVGAIAVGARGEPRFTRDVDLAVSLASDAEAERLLGLLIRGGYQLRELFQHVVSQEIVTARLAHHSSPDVLTDILVRTFRIEPEVVSGAEVVEVFPDFSVDVARTGHLIAMKVLSRRSSRPLDDGDLAHLLRVATEEDLLTAECPVELIQTRGVDPDRDLIAEFDDLRRRFRVNDSGGRIA